MARHTVSDDDRKMAYAVSLTREQRETFKRIGGSKWLQGHLDRLGSLTPRAKKMTNAQAVRAGILPNKPVGVIEMLAKPNTTIRRKS